NLPQMPGHFGSTFPYHMTPNDPLGLIFRNYEPSAFENNEVLEQAFAAAKLDYDGMIAGDATLANRTLDVGWDYEFNPDQKGEDYYQLFIHPEDPAMRYRDIPLVIGLLAEWAREYRTCETDFDIFGWLETGERRRLGNGNVLFII
ncbi:MAG: hypothetical protein Q9174_006316, partial [Haloplaca sp. 1 TL-2023]